MNDTVEQAKSSETERSSFFVSWFDGSQTRFKRTSEVKMDDKGVENLTLIAGEEDDQDAWLVSRDPDSRYAPFADGSQTHRVDIKTHIGNMWKDIHGADMNIPEMGIARGMPPLPGKVSKRDRVVTRHLTMDGKSKLYDRSGMLPTKGLDDYDAVLIYLLEHNWQALEEKVREQQQLATNHGIAMGADDPGVLIIDENGQIQITALDITLCRKYDSPNNPVFMGFSRVSDSVREHNQQAYDFLLKKLREVARTAGSRIVNLSDKMEANTFKVGRLVETRGEKIFRGEVAVGESGSWEDELHKDQAEKLPTRGEEKAGPPRPGAKSELETEQQHLNLERIRNTFGIPVAEKYRDMFAAMSEKELERRLAGAFNISEIMIELFKLELSERDWSWLALPEELTTPGYYFRQASDWPNPQSPSAIYDSYGHIYSKEISEEIREKIRAYQQAMYKLFLPQAIVESEEYGRKLDAVFPLQAPAETVKHLEDPDQVRVMCKPGLIPPDLTKERLTRESGYDDQTSSLIWDRQDCNLWRITIRKSKEERPVVPDLIEDRLGFALPIQFVHHLDHLRPNVLNNFLARNFPDKEEIEEVVFKYQPYAAVERPAEDEQVGKEKKILWFNVLRMAKILLEEQSIGTPKDAQKVEELKKLYRVTRALIGLFTLGTKVEVEFPLEWEDQETVKEQVRQGISQYFGGEVIRQTLSSVPDNYEGLQAYQISLETAKKTMPYQRYGLNPESSLAKEVEELKSILDVQEEQFHDEMIRDLAWRVTGVNINPELARNVSREEYLEILLKIEEPQIFIRVLGKLNNPEGDGKKDDINFKTIDIAMMHQIGFTLLGVDSELIDKETGYKAIKIGFALVSPKIFSEQTWPENFSELSSNAIIALMKEHYQKPA